MSNKFSFIVGITAVTFAGACANTSGNTSVACSALKTTSATPNPAFAGTVFTIVMENHSLGQIYGNKAEAPFINSLIDQNALASGYHDNFVHPSEPNYFELVAGENFGVLDDSDPIDHHISSTSHIADQLDKAGVSWRAYMDSMGTPCNTDENYPYLPKHDPFVFFNDMNGWDGSKFNPTERCMKNVVDYSQFDKDLAAGTLPKFVWITPNMIHDMHDGSTADGDKWLSEEVPKILSSKAFNDGGVLFLTWDEGGGLPQSDDPPMIVISSHAKRGYVSKTEYDTSSYLKTVQTILGLDALPCDTNGSKIETMAELFDVPLTNDTNASATTTSGVDGGQ